jgi:hypothetical protein
LIAKSNQLKKIYVHERFSNPPIDSSISSQLFPLFFLDPTAFEFPRSFVFSEDLGGAAEFPEDFRFLFGRMSTK